MQSKENDVLTLNDIEELSDLLQKATKPILERPNPKNMFEASTEAMDILDNLAGRVPSLNNLMVVPIVKQMFHSVLGNVVDTAKKVGDRYGQQIENDLDNGRYNRLADLLKLSFLNQIRLQYGRSPQFSKLREYIVKQYHSDVADTEGVYGFVPTKDNQTSVLWHIVENLFKKGLVSVVEEISIDSKTQVSIIILPRSVP